MWLREYEEALTTVPPAAGSLPQNPQCCIEFKNRVSRSHSDIKVGIRIRRKKPDVDWEIAQYS